MKTYAQALVYSVKMRRIACYMHTTVFLLCLYVEEALSCIEVNPTAGPYTATVIAI